MIWLLLVILFIVAIVAISRSGKKNKLEAEKLETEVKNLKQEQTQASTNVADELLKLKQLLDTGVITKEEFELQKKRVLDNNQE